MSLIIWCLDGYQGNNLQVVPLDFTLKMEELAPSTTEMVQELPPQDEDSAGIVTTPQQSPSTPKPQEDDRTLGYVRPTQSPVAGSGKPTTSTEGPRSILPSRSPTQPVLGVRIDKTKLAHAVEVIQFY